MGRRALGILYGGVALFGVLHLDPSTTLLVVPFFAVLVMGLRWSMHQALLIEATPSIAFLLPAATVGALFAPFVMGIHQLGDRGVHLLLALVGLLTILGSHWLCRLEVPTGQAPVDGQSAPPPPRSTEAPHHPPHELLQSLTLEDLVDEWRRSDELFHPTSLADPRAAADWRGGLLDELERRDPRGFDHWVLDGMTRGPEHHIRAGSDGAATGSDDPTR
ncbi:hypothetical protein [Geodermatophilus obscurus]|uniref:hypothetical protein n=1 Tax=Geodermatophilus obscurus TaxID=1861 RepID=UPI00019B6FFA|nr:hypothetical protein [Geodermatophilus obscurus]